MNRFMSRGAGSASHSSPSDARPSESRTGGKKLLLTIPFLLLAAACSKQAVVPAVQNQSAQNQATQNQSATSTEMTKQGYVISDSKKVGWKTYTNTKYNFIFDYPSDFELQDKGGGQLPEGNGGNLDLYKIDLRKNDNTVITILMNVPSAGCGEIAEKIGESTLQANGVKISKLITKRADVGTRCIVYNGFSKGIYIVASMPQTNISYEKIFDAVVATFKFAK